MPEFVLARYEWIIDFKSPSMNAVCTWVGLLIAMVPGLAQREVTGELLGPDGEPLPYVLIAGADLSSETYTNELGRFSIHLAEGVDSLTVFSGLYGDTTLAVSSFDGPTASVGLSASSLPAVEVLVSRTSIPGAYYVRPEQIAAVPALLGEADVLRSLQALPGVDGGAEGSAGVSIRGADPSQTLVLVDEVPIYSPSTLFGYFGAVNYNLVRDVTVYRAGFPARYGGRTGGFVDVASRRGRRDAHRGEVSVGFPNVGVTLEGPAGRGSYFATARGAYLGALFALGESRLLQGDAFARTQSKVGNWTTVASGYANVSQTGGRYRSGEESDLAGYRNLVGTVYASRVVPRGTLRLQAYATNYENTAAAERKPRADAAGFETRRAAGLTSYSLASRYAGASGGVAYQAGGQLTAHRFYSKGSTTVDEAGPGGRDERRERSRGTALEAVAFAGAEVEVLPSATLSGGARVSHLGSRSGGRTYVEPRAAVRFGAGPRAAVTLAFDRTIQSQHVIGAPLSAGGGFESFHPATRTYPAARARQYSLAYRRDFGKLTRRDGVEGATFEVAGFYSRSTGLVASRNYINEPYPDFERANPALLVGDGRAFGGELGAYVPLGRFATRIAYTYLTSERRFDDLNDGQNYPYDWERPHRVSVLATWNPRSWPEWLFTAQQTYQSGYPYSSPTAIVSHVPESGIPVPRFVYAGVNGARAPAHHRLDVSARWTPVRADGRSRHAWTFSLYNLYARANPTAVVVEIADRFEFIQPDDTPRLTGYEAAVTTRSLFRAVPGVRYRYTW